jgi:hypothetical protein
MSKLAECRIQRIERKALNKVLGAMAITTRQLRERCELAKMRCKTISVADDYAGQSAFAFIDAVQKQRRVIGQSSRHYKEALKQAQKSFKASEHDGSGRAPGWGGGGTGGGGTGKMTKMAKFKSVWV